MKLGIFLFALFLGYERTAADWSYSDIPAWNTDYPTCMDSVSSLQSPFDIITDDVVKDTSIEPLKFTQAYFQNVELKLENDGHTIKASLKKNKKLEVSGATLGGDTYKFLQLHFHWGTTDDPTKGSEYKIDGKSYGMSLHMVHMNKKYPDLDTALANSDGLLVLGFLFDIKPSGKANPTLKKITDQMKKLKNKDNKASLIIRVGDFFRFNSDFGKFITFSGSLTTPPCSEAVTWFVFPTPIKATNNQLKKMNTALFTDGSPMTENYRPLQMANGREMKTNM